MDHMLAFILFAAMASELVFVPRGRSPTLLLLAVLGFVDFIAGVSIQLTQPKIGLERTDQAPASLWQFLPPKNKSGSVSGLLTFPVNVMSLCPQSSSASRVTAGASGFFILSQSFRSTAAIARTEALADDPLEPELACMPEHHIAGLVDMLVE